MILWLKGTIILQFLLLGLAMVCVISKPTPIEVVEIVPDYVTFEVEYATIYADETGKFVLSEITYDIDNKGEESEN